MPNSEEYNRAAYLKALLNARDQLQNNNDVLVNPSNQLGNPGTDINDLASLDTSMSRNTVTTVPTLNEPESSDKQDRNWWQRTLDTIDDFANNINEGFFSVVDGLFDAGVWLAGTVGNWFGSDTQWAEDLMNEDWKAQVTNFYAQQSFGTKLLSGDLFRDISNGTYLKNWGDVDDSEESRNDLNQTKTNSYSAELGNEGQAVYDNIIRGIGNVLPSVAVGVATGGASAGAQLAAGAATTAGMSVSAAGNATTEALNDGAEWYKAGGSGIVSGVIEAGTELASFGIGKFAGKIGGRAATFGTNVAGARFASEIGKHTIKELGQTALEEGTEEFVSDILAPFAKAVYKGSEAFEEYSDPELYKNAVISFAGGAIGGVFGNVMQTSSMNYKYGSDGMKIIIDLQEATSMHQAALSEAKKGSLANQQYIGDLQYVIGSKVKDLATNLEHLSTYRPLKFKQVMDLIRNPNETIRTLEKESGIKLSKDEKTAIRNSRTDIEDYNSTLNAINSDVYSVITNEINSNNSKEEKKSSIVSIGNYSDFTGKNAEKEFLQRKIGGKEQLIVNPKNKDKIYDIVAEQSIKKSVKQLSANEKASLIKAVQNDKQLKNLISSENTENKPISDESLTAFMRSLIAKRYDYDKYVFSNKGAKKMILSILQKAKGKLIAPRDSKLIHQIDKTMDIVEKAEVSDYNNRKEESTNERNKSRYTDEFRRVQEESRRVSRAESSLYHSKGKEVDSTLRARLSDVFRRELEYSRGGFGDDSWLLENTGSFKVYKNIDGELFHDIFEISRTYLENGELVDLHSVETTQDGIGYNECKNYLSDDGLSGFSITPDGDLISVFNLNDRRGWLRSIAPFVKVNVKTLDCYASKKVENQNLREWYEKIFGFKTASLMEYNMELDHDDIAKNHGNPQVAFMVNPELIEKAEVSDYNNGKEESTNERNKSRYTDEFRRVQEESRGMSNEDTQRYRNGSQELSQEIRRRLSRTYGLELNAARSKRIYSKRTLLNPKTNQKVSILENVDGTLFHDIFKINRNYLKNGELVDLHSVETTQDGIGYNECKNYLSDDGLSGFSITPDGDLISVFNLNDNRGFLKTIAPFVKANVKTLDCYASKKQNLKKMYEKIFGFKTASLMEYNMELDHDDIAKNHGNPQVAFMVNPELIEKAGVNAYNNRKEESTNERNKSRYTDEFRRVQEESRRDSTSKSWAERDGILDDNLRGRLSRIFGQQIQSYYSSSSDVYGLLENTGNFKVYKNIDGELFHDIFEVSRTYLANGELVDLHNVETTKDEIGYNECKNYLSDDGLSGFSITPDGDLISVFNANKKRGFLKAISDFVKANVKTLDCYASEKQNLEQIYSTIFGFKTASLMEYNMELDHDDIAENHGNPQVAFMVNPELIEKAGVNAYNNRKEESTNERNKSRYTDEFRRVQEESRRTPSAELLLYHSKGKEVDSTLRARLSDVFRRELEHSRGGIGDDSRLLENTRDFKVYKNIDGELFHDIFEVSRTYLANGELVDLHNVETTKDEIGYNECKNYLSDDGLSGFSITPYGDLISVFNLNDRRGWLRSIAPFVKENVKTLDCYASKKQNLREMYEKYFNFKTASLMEYNMELDHDDIAKNHGNPQVAFMVNINQDVELETFNKDQYNMAVAHQQSFFKKDVSKQKIDIAEKKTAIINEKKADKRTVKAISDNANLFQSKFVTLKSSTDIMAAIVEQIEDTVGEKVKITNMQTKELFSDFNSFCRHGKENEFMQGMRDITNKILDSKIEFKVAINEDKSPLLTSLSLRELIKNSGIDIGEYANSFAAGLNDILLEKSKTTRIQKILSFYNVRIDRLNNLANVYKEQCRTSIHAMKSLQRINSKLDNNKLNLVKNGDRYVPMLQIYKKAIKGVKLTKASNGISPVSIDYLIANMANYTADNISTNMNDIIPFHQNWRDSLDMFVSRQITDEKTGERHFPNRRLQLDEMAAVNSMLSEMNKDMTALIKGEIQERWQKMQIADQETRVTGKSYDEIVFNGISNMVRREMEFASSPRVFFKKYFGESSDTYDIIYNKVSNSYNQKLIQQWNFTNALNNKKKSLGIKDNIFQKKINVDNIDLPYGVVLDIYMHSKASRNHDVLTSSGYTVILDKKPITLSINENTLLQIEEKLTPEMKELGDYVLDDLYNNSLREYKKNADMHVSGFQQLLTGENEIYYPLNRADTQKAGEFNAFDYDLSLDPANFSNNKHRTKDNHKAIKGMDFQSRLNSYIDAITKYGEMHDSLTNLDSYLNQMTTGDNGKLISRYAYLQQKIPNFKTIIDYYSDVISGVPVNRSRIGNSKIFSNLVSSTLGGNVSVVFKQTASLPMIMNEVSVASWTKALTTGASKLSDYRGTKEQLESMSGILAQRWGDNDVIKAQILSQQLSKFAKAFGFPMAKVDEGVIVLFGYTAAQYEAKALGHGKIGTEENTQTAIEILNRIVTRTQSNAIPMEMSMNRTGATGSVRKAFSYFQSDAQNKASYIYDLASSCRYAKKRLRGIERELAQINNQINQEYVSKNLTVPSELENLKTNLEKMKVNTLIDGDTGEAVKKSLKLLASLLLSGLIIAGVEQLVQRLYGRKGWDENTLNDFGKSLFIESTINNLPYMSTIINAIEYKQDVNDFELTPINHIIDIASSIQLVVQNGGNNVLPTLFSLSTTLGDLTGIPFKNIYNLIIGVWKNVNPDGYKVDAIVRGYSDTYISSQYKSAVASGANRRSEEFLTIMMNSYKTGTTDQKIIKELNSLYQSGYDVLPSNSMESYENEDGNIVQLTETQKSEFKKYYATANKEIKELMKMTDYRTATQKQQAESVKKIYDIYYQYAKASTLKTAVSSRLAKLVTSTKGNVSIVKYVIAGNYLSSITATKYKSRKDLVLEFINRLRGFSRQEKLILLALNGYSVNEENKNQINLYLNNFGTNKKTTADLINV